MVDAPARCQRPSTLSNLLRRPVLDDSGDFDSSLMVAYTVGVHQTWIKLMADAVDKAIERIIAGATGDECEMPGLDFKQDANGSHSLDVLVTRAAICFANAAGGSIVIGVSDKARGQAALLGTLVDADALCQRILELSKPPLMTEIEARRYPARLLVVRVQSGSTVYADTQGRSWQRAGKNCVPLQPHDMARLSQERAGFDWSAQPSGRAASNAVPEALQTARSLLASLNDNRREIAKHSDADLLRALGVTCDDGSLNRSGSVLFCQRDDSSDAIVYQYKLTPGGEPRAVQRTGTPLVIGFGRVMEAITSRQSTTPVAMPNGQQLTIEDFPSLAVREALSNAICHRDWQFSDPITIDHSPEVFSVTSPGPLVAGVTPDNILTIPSRPRNRALAAAVRLLGLAEQTGRGVDRMFREVIRSGRELPIIVGHMDRVKVSFVGGAPDANIARFVARLPEAERDDTDTMLLLFHLCRAQTVTAAQAAPLLQKPPLEISTILRRLAAEPIALLEPTRHSRNRTQGVYRLREEAVRGLGAAVTYNRRTLDEMDRKIIEHLKEYGKITNRTLQNFFEVHVFRARDILSNLQSRGIIVRVSTVSRGSKVEWGPGPKFPKTRVVAKAGAKRSGGDAATDIDIPVSVDDEESKKQARLNFDS